MMLSIDFTMTLIALLTIPLSLVMIRIIVKHSQKYFKQQQEYLGHVNGHVEEMYGGHVVIKAFNGEDKSVETFNKRNDTFITLPGSHNSSHLMMPFMRLISNMGYVAVSIWAVTGSF